jgi:hypothetical protein
VKNIDGLMKRLNDAVSRNDKNAGAAVVSEIGAGLLEDLERIASAMERIAAALEADQIVDMKEPPDYRGLPGRD